MHIFLIIFKSSLSLFPELLQTNEETKIVAKERVTWTREEWGIGQMTGRSSSSGCMGCCNGQNSKSTTISCWCCTSIIPLISSSSFSSSVSEMILLLCILTDTFFRSSYDLWSWWGRRKYGRRRQRKSFGLERAKREKTGRKKIAWKGAVPHTHKEANKDSHRLPLFGILFTILPSLFFFLLSTKYTYILLLFSGLKYLIWSSYFQVQVQFGYCIFKRFILIFVTFNFVSF